MVLMDSGTISLKYFKILGHVSWRKFFLRLRTINKHILILMHIIYANPDSGFSYSLFRKKTVYVRKN